MLRRRLGIIKELDGNGQRREDNEFGVDRVDVQLLLYRAARESVALVGGEIRLHSRQRAR